MTSSTTGLNSYYKQTFGSPDKQTGSDEKKKNSPLKSQDSSISEETNTINGVFLEPRLLFEGKAYNVISVNNKVRVPVRKNSGKGHRYFEISMLLGPKYTDDGSGTPQRKENKKNQEDNEQENSLDNINPDSNLEDLNAFLQDQDINSFEGDEDGIEKKQYNQKKISKLLQERYMPVGEGTPRSSHYLKSNFV